MKQKQIILKRYNILIIIIIFLMTIILLNLFIVQIIKNKFYKNKVEELTVNTVLGSSSPRGLIYDRNHKLIVGNSSVRVIYYQKPNNITTKEEIEVAYLLSEMIDIDYSTMSDNTIKKFWIKNNEELASKKITAEERQKLKERKITSDDIEKLKLERINEEIKEYKEKDLKAAYIYALMNEGYYYAEKVIKKNNITDPEFAKVSENIHLLKGINTKIDWERYYPYQDVFKVILGTVSNGLPYESKSDYLSKGYTLNDRVGRSYLEYQYENLLKGEKDTFQIMSDNSRKLVKEGKRGKDIILTIDIELQKAVEEILIEEITKAKSEPNTELYNRSFVVISNPNTGEILAMAGKQIVKENGKYVILDYTPGIMTSPVAVGSVIKGASHIVGYNTGAIKIGEKISDECIKIASTPLKCSWRAMGPQDDISALKNSSNVFQYKTAIKVGKGTYEYNKPVYVEKEAFTTYRNIFNQFGLGVKTEIDLPIESLGYIGTSTDTGYLLDFATGQYDTYTPIQLNQYINTIANNGNRMKPYLLKGYYDNDKIIYTEPKILNKVDTKEEYLKRVQTGFHQVLMAGGTGYSYMDSSLNPAGKTGTSQSFVDTNKDGLIDTETISHTFSGYAPYDNPIASFTIVSPDIYNYKNKTTYRTKVNSRISYRISKKFFEIYQ